jgi:hypothetical protein
MTNEMILILYLNKMIISNKNKNKTNNNKKNVYAEGYK